jgi:hypothetical protein
VVARVGCFVDGRAARRRRNRTHGRGRAAPPASMGDAAHGAHHHRSGLVEGRQPPHRLRDPALRPPHANRPRSRAHSDRRRPRARLGPPARRRPLTRGAPERWDTGRGSLLGARALRPAAERTGAACRGTAGHGTGRHATAGDAREVRRGARSGPGDERGAFRGRGDGPDGRLLVRASGVIAGAAQPRPQRPAPVEHPRRRRSPEVLRLG